MNQPESLAPGSIIPLQQHKGQLINKGYSYHEIKQDDAVIIIFRSCEAEPAYPSSLPPITEN